MMWRIETGAAKIAYLLLVLILLAAPVLQGCGGSGQDVQITVGAGDSPEQQLLGEISRQMLNQAGYRVRLNDGLGSAWMVRKAAEAGSVDLVWDYTGRVWLDELGHDQVLTDSEDLFYRLRQEDALHGLSWVTYADAQDRSVLVMTESQAASEQILSISNLAYYLTNYNPDLALCTTQEIDDSAYGPAALKRVYGASFKAPNTQIMSAEEAVAGLREGSCHCALVPASALPASASDLRTLWDDLGLMPASNLAPVVRSTTLNDYPDLAPYLRRLCAVLTGDELASLLEQVAEGRSAERVARQFLRGHDVISTPTPTPTNTPRPTKTGTLTATPTGTLTPAGD